MAIQDATLFFFTAQALSGAGPYQDVIDLGVVAGLTGWGAAAVEAVGGGQNIYWNIVVTTAITVGAEVVTLSSSATVDGVPDLSVAPFPLASISLPVDAPIGTRIAVTIPSRLTERYLQVNSNGGSTAGAATSWISSAPMDSNINMKA